MLGWGVPTYDSEYIFNFLVHTKGEAYGSWNSTRFSNAELGAAIQALASETNLAARDESIGAIWDQVQEEVLYLPIHHQVLNWGMKSRVDSVVDPEDSPKFKYFAFN
jgi:peptide/nickel transport system substrate-binding protein